MKKATATLERNGNSRVKREVMETLKCKHMTLSIIPVAQCFIMF